jgi:hypothetical protein
VIGSKLDQDTGYPDRYIVVLFIPSFLPSFLPLGATAQGELWPPEQSAFRLTAWFLNNLVFMV